MQHRKNLRVPESSRRKTKRFSSCFRFPTSHATVPAVTHQGSLISRAIDIVHQTRLAGVTEFIIVGLRRKSAENMGKPQRGSHCRFYLRSCSGQCPDSVSIERILRTLTHPRGMPSSSAALSTKELGSSMKYAPESVNRR